MSLQTPVYTALSQRQHNAAYREFKHLGVEFRSDGRRNT